jgi:hypothetical protein
LGGLVLALAAVIKLVPTLPALFLVCQQWWAVGFVPQRRRSAAHATTVTTGFLLGALLFLLVIPGAFLGWRRNVDYLRVWWTKVVTDQRVGLNQNFNVHSFRNQSLANAAYLWTTATTAATARNPKAVPAPTRPERVAVPGVRFVIVAALGALAVMGLTIGRRQDVLDQATAFGLSCCATLLVSPISWTHYYLAWLPAVLCVPIWIARCGYPLLSKLLGAYPAVLCWVHYLLMEIVGPLGLLGLGATAWFFVACSAVVWIETRTRRDDLADSSADVTAAEVYHPHIKVRPVLESALLK